MQQMPPLPVRLNVELANNFLPKAVANGVCQMPYMAAPMHGESFCIQILPEEASSNRQIAFEVRQETQDW